MQLQFEPGRRREGAFTDFAEMAAFGPVGWKQQHIQIEGGSARVDYCSVEARSLKLEIANWSRGFMSRGEAPSGMIAFAAVDCGTDAPRFQGRAIDPRRVTFLPADVEFEFVARGQCDMTMLTVERPTLERHIRAVWGSDPPSFRSGYAMPLAAEVDHKRLRPLLGGLVGAFVANAAALKQPAVAARAEDQLLAAILTATAPEAVAVHPAYRHRMARAAASLLRAQRDTPMTLQGICTTLGVSWRALDLGFRELFGLTPSAYLRVTRMHRAREALHRADPSAATVTTIATEWGFFHFGRFAVEYRRLFGESPSDTLWKRRA